MRRVRRLTLLTGLLAAVAILGPTREQAYGQYAFRGSGYFGGGRSWTGGVYYFERFGIINYGNPFFGYSYPYYGMPYASMGYPGFGFGATGFPYYGYGYGFNSNVETYPFYTLSAHPFFTYVDSSQNSPTPRVLDLSVPSTSQNPEAALRREPAEPVSPTLAQKAADSRIVPTAASPKQARPRTIIHRADQDTDSTGVPTAAAAVPPAGRIIISPTASR